MAESFSRFNEAYPQYAQTKKADRIRSHEYHHLSIANHVCLDYIGHGLFSHSQEQSPNPTVKIASTSTSSSPPSSVPFFETLYKPVNLKSQLLNPSQESEFESRIRKRIMHFMNTSEDDYSLVFAANQSSAFKLLADSYPFKTNQNLLTVYDHDNEAVETLVQSSKKRGARVRSAEFTWPVLRVQSLKLRKIMVSKRKKKEGLFVFPLQSRLSGARYSYQWMNLAQENGWHVLLDACALGAKDMETLGLSLFRPDFLVCSFFKIFGSNPSGFACLFVKKTIISVLNNPTTASSIGIVSLVPVSWGTGTETECRGLDNADALGLIRISSRTRYLVNWLVNALMSLRYPNSEDGCPLVRIYGPKISSDRGPAVAFNVFDWKGEKVDPGLVQKLADRSNISLSCGFLNHIWFKDKYEEEKERIIELQNTVEEETSGSKKTGGISAVTAYVGFLTNFEDMYRLWAFVSCFLDADFVEKERWRYKALNQKIIEV